MGALSLLACHAFRQELGLWEASLRSGPLLSPAGLPRERWGQHQPPNCTPTAGKVKQARLGPGWAWFETGPRAQGVDKAEGHAAVSVLPDSPHHLAAHAQQGALWPPRQLWQTTCAALWPESDGAGPDVNALHLKRP